jgi:3,4-dihydroxy 2-butanone 4-phosphate synthase / GTP cyclohydrolase II
MDKFDSIPDCVNDIKSGKMVVVVDDENRENEGDLIMAACKARPEDINFMAAYGRGLVCAPISNEIASRLDLHLIEKKFSRDDSIATNFTVPVDFKEGTTTGISMADRAKTVNALSEASSKPEDFLRPGHIFPLIAHSMGLKQRQGHTEATIALVEMAGLPLAGVLCEIIMENGEMARLPYLFKFAKKHGLRIVSIKQLCDF